MLRKRTAFKPNLSKAAAPSQPPAGAATSEAAPSSGVNATPTTQRPQSPTKTTPLTRAECTKDTSQDGVGTATNQPTPFDQVDSSSGDQQTSPSSIPTTATTTTPIPLITTVTKEIDEESSKRVHEAITQLTGQKFEPIKSISLRNSTKKNVKLKDLLFFNPPLTKDQKRHKKNIHLAKKNERKRLGDDQDKSKANVDNINDDDSNHNDTDEMNTEETSLVPKVKLGPEGKLILDESSTIINRKNSIKAKEAIIEDNEEIISRTNYDSYRRKPASTSQTKWSLEDTQKFYQALTIFGTDFSMMESLLFSGHRNRTELHKKFKREERTNKTKIDIALTNRISLDSEELDQLRDMFYKT